MPSCLQIVRAVVGLISLWRGTADLAPVSRLTYQECLDPSLESSQPWSRKCLMNARLLGTV